MYQMNSKADLENHEYLEPHAQKYQAKLVAMKERFVSILDDFKKYYIFSSKNPDVEEYQQHYLNSKTNLQKINKEVFTMSNDIEKNIENLNVIVMRLNTKLSTEKQLNGELVILNNKIQNTRNGAETMLDDSVEIYNKQYYYNLEIFISILLLAAMLAKLSLPSKK
jgi:hypothetical protein